LGVNRLGNAEAMTENENWSLIITPKRKLLDLQIRKIIHYRDLIFLFVKRDFVTQYKQTILGPFWYIISPLISTVMYTFVFGRLANIGTDAGILISSLTTKPRMRTNRAFPQLVFWSSFYE
jgi:hypothetical protein